MKTEPAFSSTSSKDEESHIIILQYNSSQGLSRERMREMNKGLVSLMFILYLCNVLVVLKLKAVYGNLTMKAVLYAPGDISNMRTGTVAKPAAEKSKVLIRTYYTALNRADTLQRRGLYPPPPGESDILGLEISGVIEDVGEECVGKWK